MIVVIDTNILISGIFWKGKPYKILELWMKNRFDLIITQEILNEYIEVIERMNSNKIFVSKWKSLIVNNSKMIKSPQIFNLCTDKDDNKFLDCSYSGKADYLVSGDKHLLSLKSEFSIKIVKATEFLKSWSDD